MYYSHVDLPLLSWLQHTTGPASTMLLATNDWSPVAYFAVFVCNHEYKYRDVATRSRFDFLGPKKSTRDLITEQTVDVHYHVTVSFNTKNIGITSN